MNKFVPIAIQPKVVCLCGSTKFKDAFVKANFDKTMADEIVLTVGSFTQSDLGGHAEQVFGEDQKRQLDWLHKQKILMADYVYVLNVGGYIGSSTRSEIDFALAIGKPVEYLEPIIFGIDMAGDAQPRV